MLSSNETPWIPTDTQVQHRQSEFLRDYVRDSSGDLFQYTYGIGYWAYGVEFIEDIGWLVFEHGEECDPRSVNHTDAVRAWESGEPLPPKYFRWDNAAGIKAFDAACKKWGMAWFDGDFDKGDVDNLMQYVFFGRICYG